MTLPLRPCRPVSATPCDQPSYPSAEPDTDLRWLFAGSKWHAPGSPGYPVRTTSGEWMIPIYVDLPYTMLASLEAAAQSQEIGDIVRAALVAAGHGAQEDIAGVRSDRFATLDECRETAGTTRI